MRTLIVEDEVILAEAIAEIVTSAGGDCVLVHDGQDAIDLLCAEFFDLVVLDRDLPRVHGDEVCRFLMGCEDRPRILMLTASADLDAVVSGLELGADDYLAKPFAGRELVARVRALTRRSHTRQTLTLGDLVVDTGRHSVVRSGTNIVLTPKEFAVLEVLLRAEGDAISAERLLADAWDENANPFTNSVKVTVSTLRRKLGEPRLIVTVNGAGYAARL